MARTRTGLFGCKLHNLNRFRRALKLKSNRGDPTIRPMKCTETLDAGGQGRRAAWAGRGGTCGCALAATGLAAPGAALAQAALVSTGESAAPALATALVLAVLALGISWVWFAVRQRRHAQRLRQAQLQLHSLANLLDVWLWRSDAQHRVTRIRPPAGATPSQWAQRTLGRPLLEQFPTRIEAALQAQLDAHAPLDGIEVTVPSASGEPRPGRLRGTALTNAQGRFDGYMGVVRESAAAATAALGATEPASPMPSPATEPTSDHADESLAYTLSHDLRAPIRVVDGFARILKEDFGHALDRIGNDHLDRVLGAAARMSSMIDALLSLSQLSAKPLERQPVNLSQLASYVAEDLRRLSPQREVSLHVDPDMQVQGDPTLLRMVLENLIGNAWKYTGKRSDAQIWFEHRVQDRREVFVVRDNGAGFDMRFAERLFSAFQRLHSASEFQGTGVGLVSVRRIVRRHGGDIWAEAAPGQGARFEFTLAPQGQAG